MKKYSFKNDYSEGAHPAILKRLIETNVEQQQGYGDDAYCIEARNLIQSELQADSSIHFVSGGTQANLLVISALLKPYESVVAAESGHIAVHETGAIEATGHKVNTIATATGKLSATQVSAVLATHTDEHMVKPRMVYISNSTEVGSVYTKAELTELYSFCRQNNLILFIDGARLASALTSHQSDVLLRDLPHLCDVFYIGGTKNGALLGEAIVFNTVRLADCFRYNMKQKGGLLAKSRLLGIQFATLFQNNLFLELGAHANQMANLLAEGLQAKGYNFLTEPSSNQIFPIVPNATIALLASEFEFFIWQKIDEDHSAIRLVTSWATLEDKVELFLTRC